MENKTIENLLEEYKDREPIRVGHLNVVVEHKYPASAVINMLKDYGEQCRKDGFDGAREQKPYGFNSTQNKWSDYETFAYINPLK